MMVTSPPTKKKKKKKKNERTLAQAIVGREPWAWRGGSGDWLQLPTAE